MGKTSKKNNSKPIIIHVGRQHDGGVYDLDPLSLRRIRENFPMANVIPGILIGYQKEDDFIRVHGPLWSQMVAMLTGLNNDQISMLGGVRLYDPETESVIWEWKPEPASRQR